MYWVYTRIYAYEPGGQDFRCSCFPLPKYYNIHLLYQVCFPVKNTWVKWKVILGHVCKKCFPIIKILSLLRHQQNGEGIFCMLKSLLLIVHIVHLILHNLHSGHIKQCICSKLHIGHIVWNIDHIFLPTILHILHIEFGDIL